MTKTLLPKPNTEATPAPTPFTGIAVTAYKVDGLLCESAELTIVDGIVTSTKILTRGADLPAVAVGCASRSLWKHYKLQYGVAQ